MKYIKKDLGSYKIHLIKTNKFKTIKVRVNFRSPIVKEEITIRNILSDIMIQSSKNYKSKRDLTIKSQDLYSVDVNTSTSRLGNYNTMNFYLSVLNDKYTEKGNMRKALDFFVDIIFNPDIENNKFKSDKLDIVKDLANKSLLSIKEDPAGYSLMRMFEELDPNRPDSYRMIGYIEDLEKINESNLYKYYKNMMKNDIVDIFVIGDIDTNEMLNYFKENVKFKTLKKIRTPYILDEVKARSKRLVKKEKFNTTQSKLAIGCRTYNISEYERNYPLTLFNIIFGGSSDSKLFKVVREKNSLCYSIGSVPNKLDNLIIVRTDIDKENYTKTVNLIDKVLNDIKKGKFNEEDINIAKSYYMTALDDIEESELRIINNYFMMEIINSDTIEEKRNKINKVTKAEIIKVAKKVKIDTVFLLEGVNNEKN